jgi:tRNA isopentenyl-2-thiomethyl-A-37 hydroxylase MiaE
LLALAKEEIDHFEQVHNIIIKRGKLGGNVRIMSMNYTLHEKNSNGSRVSSLVERLLFSAMVEGEVVSDLRYYQKIFRMKNSLFFLSRINGK